MDSTVEPEESDSLAAQNPPPPSSGGGSGTSTGLRVGVVVAVGILAGLAVWLFVRDDNSSPSAASTVVTSTERSTTTPTTPAPTPARVTSEAELNGLAAGGTVVYWAGPPEAGYTMTLFKGENRSLYVRYLPPGVTVDDPIPPSLVVATYPLRDAYKAVKRAARSPDNVTVPLTNGGTATYAKSKPTNVYFAYPKASAQVEVYDPSPGRALQLVTSGAITQATP